MLAYAKLGCGIIDADQHWDGCDIPPGAFRSRVADQFRADAPEWVTDDGGQQVISFGNGKITIPVTANVATGMRKPAGTTASERLHEMDLDGIAAAVLFTLTVSMEDAYPGDREAVIAYTRAYNDYKIEELHDPSHDRLFTLASVPYTGVKDAVAEMERSMAKGHKGVQLTKWPAGESDPSDDDDYFWSAANDMGVPIAIHGLNNFGGGPELIARRFHYSAIARRFGRLRVGLIEQGCSWTASYLESDIAWLGMRLDQEKMERIAEARKRVLGDGADSRAPYFGIGDATLAPSEAFLTTFYTSFLFDPLSVKLRHEIGIDRMMWSTDYPHQNTSWPNSRLEFDHLFGHVPIDEVRKLVHDNAKEFFQLHEVP